ncbi:related to microsomal dipeptidase precursor [Ramularia collo-cygni]|uniref:Dipeptidase n=1 Tax=Ramularia collo-cygni TaxID=112498 RepID=A0A2D3UWC4_9PEZI|nr:related to microsomal dipeptidase precursor [Ramularia collo-cygni]CZT16507.1 related to microsomal dipeptidase precursor [Ramularia collo-cygni]
MPSQSQMDRARSLLRKYPLIDGHNDFPYMIRGWFGLDSDSSAFDLTDMPIGQTDLNRLEKGMVGAQFWSAFVPGPKHDSEASRLSILHDTLQQIDLIYRMIAKHSNVLGFAGTAEECLDTFRSGRIASLIGVEGLHQIGGCISALRLFHRLGVRYVTMCHNDHNEFVDSSNPAIPLHGGLSTEGEAVVREMNRIGMMIDLSHTSDAAQHRVLQISTAPVIFSHSSCFGLTPHARNVTDAVLAALKANGGLIMICFLPSLCRISRIGPAGLCSNETVTKPAEEAQIPASIEDVAAHIIYAAERIGYRHVGIGSDFDGMLEGPRGLDDVADYPALVAELLARGVGEGDLQNVLGGNILRVLKQVEEQAGRLKEEVNHGDMFDEVSGVWTDAQRQLLLDKGKERRSQGGVDLVI